MLLQHCIKSWTFRALSITVKNGETVSTHGRVNRRTIRKPMPMQVSSHHSLHKIQIHLDGEEVYYTYTNTLCPNTEKSFLLSA